MKKGKILIWDTEVSDGDLYEIKLDYRDWEILKDVLEAHQEHLQNLENDGDLDDHDELWRVENMIGFINSIGKED